MGCFSVVLFEQFRAAFTGAFYGLFVLPGSYQFRVPAQQDLRYVPSVERCRTRIDRRGDKTVLERIGKGRCLVGENSRDEADDAVGKKGCRDFTPGDDEVSNGYFACDEVFADALYL